MEQVSSISLSGIDYLIGLQWRMLNVGSHAELARTAEKFCYSHAVTVGTPPVCAGYAKLEGGDVPLGKTPSAAARLALLLPPDASCMVVEKIADEKRRGYWFVVLQDGVVYPDSDILIDDMEALRTRYARFMQQSPELYGSGIVDVDPARQGLRSVVELFAEHCSRSQQRHCRVCPIRRMATGRWFMLLLAVFSVGWLCVTHFLSGARQVSADELEAQRRAAAQARLEQSRHQLMAGPVALRFGETIQHVLRKVPFYVDNWRLRNIVCDLNGCALSWAADAAVLSTLARRLDVSAARLQTNLDGNLAVLQLPYAELGLDATGRSVAGTETELGKRHAFIELCQRVRGFGVHCELNEPQRPAFEDAELLPPQMLFQSGDFRVQGRLPALRTGCSELSVPWIKPRRMRIDFSDMQKPHWTLEGHYVVN